MTNFAEFQLFLLKVRCIIVCVMIRELLLLRIERTLKEYPSLASSTKPLFPQLSRVIIRDNYCIKKNKLNSNSNDDGKPKKLLMIFKHLKCAASSETQPRYFIIHSDLICLLAAHRKK